VTEAKSAFVRSLEACDRAQPLHSTAQATPLSCELNPHIFAHPRRGVQPETAEAGDTAHLPNAALPVQYPVRYPVRYCPILSDTLSDTVRYCPIPCPILSDTLSDTARLPDAALPVRVVLLITMSVCQIAVSELRMTAQTLMIALHPGIGPETAEAVLRAYPTPRSLFEAFGRATRDAAACGADTRQAPGRLLEGIEVGNEWRLYEDYMKTMKT